jgi:hypothetical protein
MARPLKQECSSYFLIWAATKKALLPCPLWSKRGKVTKSAFKEIRCIYTYDTPYYTHFKLFYTNYMPHLYLIMKIHLGI